MPRTTLLKALKALSVAFDKELNDELIAVYSLVLEGLDATQVARMVRTALSSGEAFLPRPGQLLNMAIRGGHSQETEANQEFLLLGKAIMTDTAKTLRPRTRRVALSLGTYTEFFRMGREEWRFMRRPFVRCYVEDCVDTDRTGELLIGEVAAADGLITAREGGLGCPRDSVLAELQTNREFAERPQGANVGPVPDIPRPVLKKIEDVV